MSFEGYNQILCCNGHLAEVDVYFMDVKDWNCPHCEERATWWNIVDTTNGSFDDDGERIDGYVFPEEKEPAQKCRCSECGHEHISKPATYLIPPHGIGHHVPPSRDFGWWCPSCEKWIQNEHVTFDEVHDPRCGGCGGKVGDQ